MKKLVALMMALMMALGCFSFASAEEKVELVLWHTLEEMYREDFQKLIDQFMVENPNISVQVEYQGRVAEIQEKVLSSNIEGVGLPSIFPVHSNEIKNLARDGVVENLDSYITANNTDLTGMIMKDAYAYDGSQYGLTWTITGISVFYNETIAKEEGIAFPKTWDEMDAFLRKATVKNEDGTTKRYAMWMPGWDSYYFTWMLWNFGVLSVDENGQTTVNGETMLKVVNQVKAWIDEGLIMWGYGSNGSSNMRSAFWDGNAFAIIHTSSQYQNHHDQMANKGYELGVTFPPAGDVKSTTEMFGMCMCIPAKYDAAKKEAAYKLLAYVTSKDVDREMATFTGFLANYADAMESEAGQAWLKENPAMTETYSRLEDMTCAIQLPFYNAVTDVLEDNLALIFLEDADAQEQLNVMADEIVTLYEDQ
ncbi:MAG: extracellular solute-binding protein [Clostridia bacterium]|nr:extracellular solute-binding protein [Clostridia bacterium]